MDAVYRVAIVVDGSLAAQLEDLAAGCPVWVVRTPETEAAAQRVWSHSSDDRDPMETGLTVFDGDGTPEETLLEILDTVELHHGEFSHYPPLSVIEVFGAEPTDEIRVAFIARGFTKIDTTAKGFTARQAI